MSACLGKDEIEREAPYSTFVAARLQLAYFTTMLQNTNDSATQTGRFWKKLSCLLALTGSLILWIRLPQRALILLLCLRL